MREVGSHKLPTACVSCGGRQFKDKIWNSLVSQARYQVTNQGRLLFEFDSNCIKVNNLFDTSKSVRTFTSSACACCGVCAAFPYAALAVEEWHDIIFTRKYAFPYCLDMPEK